MAPSRRSSRWFFVLGSLLAFPVGTHATMKFPLDFQRTMDLKAISRDGVVLGYESFGVTKLQLLAKVSGDPEKNAATSMLVRHTIDGKPGRSNTTRYFAQAAANAGWIKYELTFEKAGVHEILLTPRFLEVNARCLQGCGRSEISLAEVLREMNDDELAVFVGQLEGILKARLSNHEKAKAYIAKLKNRLLARDPQLGRRFPVLPPLAVVDGWRNALTLLADGEVKPKSKPSSVWRDVYKSFAAKPLPGPVALDAKIPYLRSGHFLSKALTPNFVAESQALASVMTALSQDDDYRLAIEDGEGDTHELESLDEFLDFLWSTGHRLEIHDERAFANFLAYTWHDKYIRWPTWMKTDVILPSGQELLFPAPHSQFVWQITGPQINGRVAFYLGISGAGFFPAFDEQRPQWTGLRSHYLVTDSDKAGKRKIRTATSAAEIYLQRNHEEFIKFASQFGGDGYGYLGICNDASAVIERALFPRSTFYPLFRAPELLEKSHRIDELTDIFKVLPYDSLPIGSVGPVGPGDAKAVLGRILHMNAPPLDSSYRWDEEFQNQIEEAKRYYDGLKRTGDN